MAPPVRTPAQRQGSADRERGDDWDEEYDDDGPLPDLEKDDMHARRTGTYQKAAGGTGQRFLPVPGKAKYKGTPTSGLGQSMLKPREGEKLKDRSEPKCAVQCVNHCGPCATSALMTNLFVFAVLFLVRAY